MRIFVHRNLSKFAREYSKKKGGKREEENQVFVESAQRFILGKTKKDFQPRDETKLLRAKRLATTYGKIRLKESEFHSKEIRKKHQLQKEAIEALPKEFLKEAQKPTLKPVHVFRVALTLSLPQTVWRPLKLKK